MIDRATVAKILDTADIVDVVSDFVNLRRRGANYVGLCPFHNEKTPSFYVSKAKGICHCFGCGKGGSPVNFIMEHEQLSYYEALKYLAKKYNIEVEEKELTDEERRQQSEREGMFMLNEFACGFFERQLHGTQEGQEIGMSYFKERGFNAESIKTFHLGYSPEGRSALYNAAIAKGFNRELLFKVGLCIDDQHGGGYDRFRGRVMFPVFNIAGKVVAFGGRTLRNDPAKYVNSPESLIYNKRNEIYGLYQAKRDIINKEQCVIVEGYCDVISMHQSGFKNVIASSGTALTEGHIQKIHRFSENVTEMFDGDAAGIHAAMRGVDMLLGEGLNMKVLLLPPEHDPDSFAQSHSTAQIQEYIDANEEDFIDFKMRILLKGAEKDPIKKSKAISEIVKSISVIPSNITRSVYAKECSNTLGMDEQMILREIKKNRILAREADYKRQQRENARESIEGIGGTMAATAESSAVTAAAQQPQAQEATVEPIVDAAASAEVKTDVERYLYPPEKIVIKYVVRYGMCYLCDTEYDDGKIYPTSVLEYIYNEMSLDNTQFHHPVYRKIFDCACNSFDEFRSGMETLCRDLQQKENELFNERIASVDVTGLSPEELLKKEEEVRNSAKSECQQEINSFRAKFLEKKLCSVEDDDIRTVSNTLIGNEYPLSKIFTNAPSEYDNLRELVPQSMQNLRYATVQCRIKDTQRKLQTTQDMKLLQELQQLYDLRARLSKLIGDRVINPQ